MALRPRRGAAIAVEARDGAQGRTVVAAEGDDGAATPEAAIEEFFDRLFGNGNPGEMDEARVKRDRYRKSVLDYSLRELQRVKTLAPEVDDAEGAIDALIEKVIPPQANEFTCRNCFLVKHRSQIAREGKKGELFCIECEG